MKKRMVSVLCAAAMLLAAINFAALAAPGSITGNIIANKRVLKPGCVDQITVTPSNTTTPTATSEGYRAITSDYTQTFGNIQGVYFNPNDFVKNTLGAGTSGAFTYGTEEYYLEFWGNRANSMYHPNSLQGSINAYISNPETASYPDTGIMYRVHPGSWVSVPIHLHSTIIAADGDFASKFWFDSSSVSTGGWETIPAGSVTGNITSGALFQSAGNSRIFYLTVRVPAGKNYLRVHIPTLAQFAALGRKDDALNNTYLHSKGTVAFGYAKASSTQITSYTGTGSGDTVVDYYEDPASVKNKNRDIIENATWSSGTGWQNRLVSLDDDRVSVRVEDGAAVTLQDVKNGLLLDNADLEFYSGGQKLALTARAANGVVMKAVNANSGTAFAEYTMWVYHYSTPSVAKTAPKKTLKPGIIDSYAKNADGVMVSDYVNVLGGMHADGASSGGFAFDNVTYPNSNIFWGQAHSSFYIRYGTTSSQPFTGLEYRVVPGSYIALPVRAHNTLANDADVMAQLHPVFTFSKDGSTWIDGTTAGAILNTFTESNGSARTTYYVHKIPEDYIYIRAGFTDAMAAAIATKVNSNWLVNGTYFFGMAKASWTPITAATGVASGDPVVGWYEDSAITSKDVFKVNLLGGTAQVLEVGGETVTLQNVKDNLNVTLGVIKFYDALDAEITDLSVNAADGQIIKGLSSGHLLNADGTVFAEYEIEINAVTEVKVPELSSNTSWVVVDNDGKKVIASYFMDESKTYQNLADALSSTYSEIKFVTGNGTAFTSMGDVLNQESGVKIQLVAKDCSGIPDGVVTSEYSIITDKQIKETRFESKDNSKVCIDDSGKTITVIKGLTVGQFLNLVELQFAKLEIYGLLPEDFSDPELITDENTVIIEGMSALLLLDSVSIWYDFVVVDAENLEDLSVGGGSSQTDLVATGHIIPIAFFSLAITAAGMLMAVSFKRRRRG